MTRAKFIPPFPVSDAMTAAMRAYHDAASVCSDQQGSRQGRPSTPDDFLKSFEVFLGHRLHAIAAAADRSLKGASR